jgi:hypothetical protein
MCWCCVMFELGPKLRGAEHHCRTRIARLLQPKIASCADVMRGTRCEGYWGGATLESLLRQCDSATLASRKCKLMTHSRGTHSKKKYRDNESEVNYSQGSIASFRTR